MCDESEVFSVFLTLIVNFVFQLLYTRQMVFSSSYYVVQHCVSLVDNVTSRSTEACTRFRKID